jgi:hypothetical protein
MPITAFLEDLLKAPAIHLPLGQSSDNAHLPNVRTPPPPPQKGFICIVYSQREGLDYERVRWQWWCSAPD